MNNIPFLRKTIFILLAIALFMPLVPLPMPFLNVGALFFFPYVFPKILFFKVIVEIAAIFFAMLLVADKEVRTKLNWMQWAVIIFFAVLVVASVFGVNIERSVWGNAERSDGLITIAHFVLYFLMLSQLLRSEKKWLKFFDIALIVEFLVMVYGLLQVFFPNFFYDAGNARVPATIGNAAFLAAYLIFGVFIAAFLWIRKHQLNKLNPWLHVWYGANVVLTLFVIFETQTRGALVALAAGILLLGLMLIFRSSNKKIKIYSASIIALVVLAGAGLYLMRNTSLVRNISTLNRLASISYNDTTTQSRLLTWRAAWTGWLQRPILGWGYENFNIVFDRNFPAPIYRNQGSQVWFDRAHNIVFDVGVTSGFVGLASYLALYGVAGWALWKKRYAGKENIAVVSVFGMLLVVYFLQDFFVFDTPSTYLMFYTVLAFLASPLFLHGERNLMEDTNNEKPVFEQKNSDENNSSDNDKKLNTLLSAVGIGVFVLMVGVMWFTALRPAIADMDLANALINSSGPNPEVAPALFQKAIADGTQIRFEARQQYAEFLYAQSIPNYTSTQYWTQDQNAIAELQKSIQEAPLDVKNYLHLLILYNSATQVAPDAQSASDMIQKAIDIGLQSETMSPTRAQIYYQVGQAYMNAGMTDKALAELQYAVKLSPDVVEAHWNLGAAYLLSGQNANAKEQFDIAQSLGLNENDPSVLLRFGQLYIKVKDYPDALVQYQKIVSLLPQNATMHARLASLYVLTDNPAQAKTEIQKAMDLDPTNWSVQGKYFLEAIDSGNLAALKAALAPK